MSLQNVFLYERAISFLPSMEKKNTKLEKKPREMDYPTVCQILYDLKKQQNLELSLGYSFFSININDIVCIDSHYFLLNPDCIKSYNKKTREMLFQSPFETNMFSSPEMNAITSLPATLSITTYDYSLAALAFFLLFDQEYRENIDHSKKCLESIRGTKLYYFFLRIFDPNHPTFLFL